MSKKHLVKAEIKWFLPERVYYDSYSKSYDIRDASGKLTIIASNSEDLPVKTEVCFDLNHERALFQKNNIIIIKNFKKDFHKLLILDYYIDGEQEDKFNKKRDLSRNDLKDELKKEEEFLKSLHGEIEAEVIDVRQGRLIYGDEEKSWIFEQICILKLLKANKKTFEYQKLLDIKFTNKVIFDVGDSIIFYQSIENHLVNGSIVREYKVKGLSDALFRKRCFEVNKDLLEECGRRNKLQEKKINIYGLDIDEYYRCPYRLSLYEGKGLKSTDLLKSDFIKAFVVRPGQEFEDKVMSLLDWKKAKEPLKRLIQRRVSIKQPLIEIEGAKLEREFKRFDIPYDYSQLQKIKFVGRPDMILPSKNTYFPLDVKNHFSVTKTDVLRVTYYALLLKHSFFSNKNIDKAFILLKDGIIKEVNIEEYVEDTLKTLKKIDDGRRGKIEPEFCSECRICFNYENCVKLLESKSGLSLVYQVGPSRKKMLNDIGITKIEHLAEQNPDVLKTELLEKFPDKGWVLFGSDADIFTNMVMYARALIQKKVLPISKPKFPDNITEIFLDLEYVPGGQNFLYGVLVNRKGKIKHYQFFCGDTKDELKPIRDFIKLLKKFKDYVIYTWAGVSADLPQIKLDLKSINKLELFNDISKKHIDLYKLSEKCLALPLYSYSIKDVIPYLKIPEKETRIKDGFGCLISYFGYLKNRDKQTKQDILEYNLEDLNKLVGVKEWMNNFFKRMSL